MSDDIHVLLPFQETHAGQVLREEEQTCAALLALATDGTFSP